MWRAGSVIYLMVALAIPTNSVSAQMAHDAVQIEVIRTADRIDAERAKLCDAKAADNAKAAKKIAGDLAADTKEYAQRAHRRPYPAAPCGDPSVALRGAVEDGE